MQGWSGQRVTKRSSAATSPTQAWAILLRHAREDIGPLRLQELCHDNDRVSSLVCVHTSDSGTDRKNRILLADLSRQRMTLDTLNHLLRLASSRNVRGYIKRLAWGQNDPDNPIVAEKPAQKSVRGGSMSTNMNSHNTGNKNSPKGRSMHLALRAPEGKKMEMLTSDGGNALEGIHREWRRIERMAEGLRRGNVRGASGFLIRDVVVVGRGVAVMALRFLYEALRRDEEAERATSDGSFSEESGGGSSKKSSTRRPRRMRFVSSIDPVAAANVVSDLRPESTIIISITMQGNDEMSLATKTLYNWLIQGLELRKRADFVVAKHMVLITSIERLKGTKPETVFLIPDHSRSEAFTTFTAAGLLPLAIIFGWNIVEKILAGAHDMDKHFVETNPRHNLPILLALTDVWNDAFLGSSGRMVTPFSEGFSHFPNFIAALEAQTCGRGVARDGTKMHDKKASAAAVIDGGLNGAYDRMLYQGGRVIPSELITAMDTQAKLGIDGEEVSNHDALICSFFAHADVLAFGSTGKGTTNASVDGFARPDVVPTPSILHETDVAEGNHPSTLLLCGRCDAFTCGQLVALSEHRAVIAALLWDVDPFAKKVGSSLRAVETERLREKLQRIYLSGGNGESEDEADPSEVNGWGDGKVNLATSTILRHYANRMRDQKYVVKSP